MLKRFVRRAALAALILAAPAVSSAQERLAPGALPAAERPFGTLREQAALQQAWLKKRLDTFLPALMRKHGIDMWVVPMREYNEDPVFSSITAPETFAARRRTIYVFFDKCAAAGAPATRRVRRAHRARRHVARRRVRCAHVDEGGGRRGRRTAGRALGRRAVDGAEAGRRRAEAESDRHRSIDDVRVHRRAVERRTAGNERGARTNLDGEVPGRRTAAARAHRVAAAGRGSVLREDDRARLADDADDVLRQGDRARNDAHQRSRVVVAAARPTIRGSAPGSSRASRCSGRASTAKQLGDDPIIQPGDVLHCDVGITVARLNTDTQHLAYVLRRAKPTRPPD